MKRRLSNNGRRVLAILSVAEGSAILAEQEAESLPNGNGKTRIQHCQRIRDACEKAMDAWPELKSVGEGDVLEIGKALHTWENDNKDLIEKNDPTRALLNLSLALTTDLYEEISGAMKKEALDVLTTRLFGFIRYLDRHLKSPAIDDAIRLAESWPFSVR